MPMLRKRKSKDDISNHSKQVATQIQNSLKTFSAAKVTSVQYPLTNTML